MAPISLYAVSVGTFIHSLESLKSILEKAKAHSPAEADSYPALRLYEDMLPLSFQVQIVSNISKKTLFRLLPEKGPYPEWSDDETTMDELIARVDKTLALLKTVSPKDLEGKDDEPFEFSIGPKSGPAKTDGTGYVLGYALPNVYFHLTTAYAILRMKGVPLGKTDYLLPLLLPNIHSKSE